MDINVDNRVKIENEQNLLFDHDDIDDNVDGSGHRANVKTSNVEDCLEIEAKDNLENSCLCLNNYTD